jgi:hypothetical protein
MVVDHRQELRHVIKKYVKILYYFIVIIVVYHCIPSSMKFQNLRLFVNHNKHKIYILLLLKKSYSFFLFPFLIFFFF